MAKKTKPKAKPDKPKKRRPEQLQVPGTERKVAPEIEQAEKQFTDAKADKADAGRTEKQAMELLLAAMRKNNVEIYKFLDHDGIKVTVRVKGKTTVSVTREKRPAQSEDA